MKRFGSSGSYIYDSGYRRLSLAIRTAAMDSYGKNNLVGLHCLYSVMITLLSEFLLFNGEGPPLAAECSDFGGTPGADFPEIMLRISGAFGVPGTC